MAFETTNVFVQRASLVDNLCGVLVTLATVLLGYRSELNLGPTPSPEKYY